MTSTFKSANALTQLGSLTGAQWAAMGSKYAPAVVSGLAVLGIAWQAAKLTWLLLSPTPAAVSVAPAVPVQTAQSGSNNALSPQVIADAHLFGTQVAPSGPTDPNNLPQSQSNLVLAGTMALDDPEAGFAIIGDNAASAKFYRVGATINGGARLHSVYADRVIIDRGGTLETLILPRGAPSTAPAPTVRNVAVTTPGDNLRRLANSNPSALGELLRAQPVFSNGTQRGYRIYPGRDRQQFTRLGLQPGDLVTSINGSTLDDPNRGGEILSTLTASTSATVVVERNGLSHQLTLDMAQVSIPETATATDDSNSSSAAEAPAGASLNRSSSARGPRGGRNGAAGAE